MSDPIRWDGLAVTNNGVTERSFQLDRTGSGDPVPGVMWTPAVSGASCPLVLLGHGGSGHKRSDRIVRLARWFAIQAGIASLAIDGPYHGERVPRPLNAVEYQARMVEVGIDRVVDRMVEDWQSSVSAVAGVPEVDTTRLGYLGLSMGTRFGLPLGAALGPRLHCAVLGKFGLWPSPSKPDALRMTRRLETAAAGLSAPTLFHVQSEDELFPPDGQLALFDRLGSTDKQLISYPGPHAHTDPTAIALWRRFVAGHLGRDPGGADSIDVGQPN